MEAKAFRDAFADFQALGVRVIGISGDTVDSHKSFCTKFDLQYTLLSDEDNAIRALYRIEGNMFNLIPGRETFVIGNDGVVKMVFRSQLQTKKHVQEALRLLQLTEQTKEAAAAAVTTAAVATTT